MTTTATFTHAVSDLAPGADVTFDDLWDTTGATEEEYRVLGYVKYGSQTSEIEMVTLVTQVHVYLPLMMRSYP